MKAFTDIQQSKKLAEILPIESADMCFNISQRTNMPPLMTPYCKFKEFFNMGETPDFLIPCWSLAALLDILRPDITLDHTEGEGWSIIVNIVVENPNSILQDIITEKVIADNLIDACVEMILKLNELKVL